MRLEFQILAAIALDLVFGDPRWFPHPVKLIGRFAAWLEAPMRKTLGDTRIAGTAAALIVILVTGGIAFGLVFGTAKIHPMIGTIVSVLMLYTTIAARDLAGHSTNVFKALRRGNLPLARERVSWMVGRDTENLDEAGVVRAAVESVAENTVDGVTAPLFFAVIGGPVGAMIYKAINTLDSTFGYKNERYIRFGWASARIDDLAGFIPARLTAPMIALAAAIVRLRPRDAWRVCLRDGKEHASPNSGIAEAAMAGALGVQLGGPLYRHGKEVELPTIGDPLVELDKSQIGRTNRLMLVTMIVTAAVLLAARAIVVWRAGT